MVINNSSKLALLTVFKKILKMHNSTNEKKHTQTINVFQRKYLINIFWFKVETISELNQDIQEVKIKKN